MVFSGTCIIMSLLLILRCMLGYTNDQQISPIVSPHDTWRSSALTSTFVWVCILLSCGVCLCDTMAYKLTKVCKRWQLALVCSRISSSCILNVNTWHLPLPCLITPSLCILNCKTIISSIQCATISIIVYAKFHLEKLLMLMNSIILTIGGRDTLIPPHI